MRGRGSFATGLCGNQPVLESGGDALIQQLHDSVDRRGRQVRTIRSAEVSDPRP